MYNLNVGELLGKVTFLLGKVTFLLGKVIFYWQGRFLLGKVVRSKKRPCPVKKMTLPSNSFTGQGNILYWARSFR